MSHSEYEHFRSLSEIFFYTLFDVKTIKKLLYKSNLTNDYKCKVKLPDFNKSLDEIKILTEGRLYITRLFDSKYTSVEKVLKRKDFVYIHIYFHANDDERYLAASKHLDSLLQQNKENLLTKFIPDNLIYN